jgi:hypothetical protein
MTFLAEVASISTEPSNLKFFRSSALAWLEKMMMMARAKTGPESLFIRTFPFECERAGF